MKSLLLWIVLLGSFLVGGCQVGIGEGVGVNPEAQAALARSLNTIDPNDHLQLFEYDRSQPLDMRVISEWSDDGITWTDLTYRSPMGGRVPARILTPDGSEPFPAILLMHGSGGDIELFSGIAGQYARLGAVVMLIESPHIRPGGRKYSGTMGDSWPYFTDQDRQDQIQLMIDLRRALDLLERNPLVNKDRIAFIGYSYGGAMGGLLAGIEQRITAYVLVVGDGGLVEHTSEPLPNGMPDQFRTHWVDAMWPIEPLHYIGRAAPAALLFQNGTQDELVTPGDALRYQLAGSEPKTVIWYDAGHNLIPRATQDAARWLQSYIGEPVLWMAPDYTTTAIWMDSLFSGWLVAILVTLLILGNSIRRGEVRTLNRLTIWGLTGIVLGPLALILHNLVGRGKGDANEDLGRQPRWGDDLNLAVHGSIVYLVGGLIGNLFSQGLFDGNVIFLTYLLPLILGWVYFRFVREYLRIMPMSWLVILNILWALNILVATPIMGFWRLPFLHHARLLWYIGSLTLINTLILLAIFRLLRKFGLTQRSSLVFEPKVGKPSPSIFHRIFAVGVSYLFVLGAIVIMLANSLEVGVLDVLFHLPEHFI